MVINMVFVSSITLLLLQNLHNMPGFSPRVYLEGAVILGLFLIVSVINIRIDFQNYKRIKVNKEREQKDLLSEQQFSLFGAFKYSLVVFVFSYILNYFWETWQLIFFTESFLETSPLSLDFLPIQAKVIWIISIFVITDALVISIVYIGIGFAKLSIRWPFFAEKRDIFNFIFYSTFFAASGEIIGQLNNWWEYSSIMPIILGTDLGLIPVLAFLITPLILLKILNLFKREDLDLKFNKKEI